MNGSSPEPLATALIAFGELFRYLSQQHCMCGQWCLPDSRQMTRIKNSLVGDSIHDTPLIVTPWHDALSSSTSLLSLAPLAWGMPSNHVIFLIHGSIFVA